MALSLVAVGAKITAAFLNLIVTAVNAGEGTGIVPTSVAGTGVTVGASGKVSFAAATTISVNGCFTSAYETYRIYWDTGTRTANDFTMRLRLSGTDAAGANTFGTQRKWGTGTTPTDANTNSTSWSIDTTSAGATLGASGMITLFQPAVAAVTRGIFSWGNASSTSAMWNGTGTLVHSPTTAYDGFSIILAAGSATGSLRIFGINNN